MENLKTKYEMNKGVIDLGEGISAYTIKEEIWNGILRRIINYDIIYNENTLLITYMTHSTVKPELVVFESVVDRVSKKIIELYKFDDLGNRIEIDKIDKTYFGRRFKQSAVKDIENVIMKKIEDGEIYDPDKFKINDAYIDDFFS